MPKLAEVLPKDLLQALLKMGFFIFHHVGSHVRLHHADGRRVTIALHAKPLPKGTFGAILRQANVSRQEIEELL
ncbi:MAG: type II toxin-antitoxin system HicA family toxin [Candidatus Uhrbacteria bacterium]|nr:type II toxin-antitoxin system HicA family toxin [Candidatus Uhrbacteria bacterium]